ncbi:hypothetical protein electrica_02803 [Klebsiella electrica]|uniref:DUF6886 family protein n=1 Tax=Klebsiella electrica TaxID=1259973 RepID=UPI0011531E5A|nr:DUF6886 family protein [Klebsiella electrica]QDI08906.1 hypothetical protein electrica_02803 [Klebsiella electrica]
MRLFHFSDSPDITIFKPRPLRVHVERPAGQEWLNGSLIWATDEAHELLYLFPRECPRIVFWPLPETTGEDVEKWMGDESHATAIACIEQAWFSRFISGKIYRYELPIDGFEPTGEVGMWVCRTDVIPASLRIMSDLPAELAVRNISLRVMERLAPLKSIWLTSFHASGIRLRNAQDWGKPGWTHSKPGRQMSV